MFVNKPPRLVLETMEDVRSAMQGDRKSLGPDPYDIKSVWVISLIDEIAAEGKYPYNATIKKLAEQRLGLPPKSEAEYAKEGDVLSLMVYNAQKYRRHDKIVAAGFIPFTEALLQ